MWDTRTQRIVSNDAAQITVQMETEFAAFHRPGAPDLYPATVRRDIDALAMLVFHTVNNGVYKAGLATSQAAYEEPSTPCSPRSMPWRSDWPGGGSCSAAR